MLRLLTFACALGLLSPWLTHWAVPYSAELTWLLDLASHWQWLYVALLAIGVILLARKNLQWLILLPLVALPWFSAAPQLPDAPGKPLISVRLVTANMQQMSDPSLLRAWLNAKRADVVLLQEVTPALAATLATWHDYPHQVLEPTDSPFGIALLSNLEIHNPEVVFTNGHIPRIDAQLGDDAKAFRLSVMHPMPPLTPFWHQELNQYIELATSEHDAQPLPAIIAGDLNASAWAQAIRPLHMSNWWRASNLKATWPAWGRGWFGIGIDQFIVSGPWRVTEQNIGPNIGSDHLPRSIRLSLLKAQ